MTRPPVEVGEGLPQIDPLLGPARHLQTVLLAGEAEEPTNVKGTISDEGEGLLSPEAVGLDPTVELLQDLRECLSLVDSLLLDPSQSYAELREFGVDLRFAVAPPRGHNGAEIAVDQNPGELDNLMWVVGKVSLLTMASKSTTRR